MAPKGKSRVFVTTKRALHLTFFPLFFLSEDTDLKNPRKNGHKVYMLKAKDLRAKLKTLYATGESE